MSRLTEKEIEFVEGYGEPKMIQRARSNMGHFTAYTMPRFNVNWHHKVMWKYAHAWLRGDIPFLMIEAPPRHTKTEIFSRRLPAFIYGVNPDAQVIACAYGADLASKNNRDVQRIIDSNEYRQIFPETQLSGSTRTVSGVRALRNTKEFEIVGHRGYYRSAGVGGPITGMGADYLIIDDPFKNRKEADSKTYRDTVWDWWSSTAFTRLEKNSRVLIINTRWHEDDLSGRLLAQMKTGDDSSLPWVRLRLPAVYEEGEDKDNPNCPEDPREHGDPLWPWKYDAKRLKQIESTVQRRDWHALYQQRPSVEEGGIIKKSYLRYYLQYPPRLSRVIQSWDLNFKEGLNNDYVVGTVWGEFAGTIYLLDMFRERCGFVDTCNAIKAMSKKWPQSVAKLIEAKANGEAVMDSLKREGVIGIVPIIPKESKEARLWSVEPLFRAANIQFPHPTLAPWVQIAIDELVKFPNARYDDFVDTTSQGLDYLAKGINNVLDKMTKR